jgi:hypothetical protein
LFNYGAGLKGEFGRVDFHKMNPASGKNALRELSTDLPEQIFGLYYRDEVGNISTSQAFRDRQSGVVRFRIEPRFCVLGQWRHNWYFKICNLKGNWIQFTLIKIFKTRLHEFTKVRFGAKNWIRFLKCNLIRLISRCTLRNTH